MSFHASVHTRKNENNRCLLSLITSFLVFIGEFIDIFFNLLALSTCKYSFLDVLLLAFFFVQSRARILNSERRSYINRKYVTSGDI